MAAGKEGILLMVSELDVYRSAEAKLVNIKDKGVGDGPGKSDRI